jgi:hypothetical protein
VSTDRGMDKEDRVLVNPKKERNSVIWDNMDKSGRHSVKLNKVPCDYIYIYYICVCIYIYIYI